MRMIRIVLIFVMVAGLAGCSWFLPRRLARGPVVEDGVVMFRYYAPSARRVQLAGDWPGNNWGRGDGSVGEADVGLMNDDDGDGVWELAVTLPPGRHCYLFWVDENTWHVDPGNPEETAAGPARVCSVLLLSRDGASVRIQ